jgi:hypothetical protein
VQINLRLQENDGKNAFLIITGNYYGQASVTL